MDRELLKKMPFSEKNTRGHHRLCVMLSVKSVVFYCTLITKDLRKALNKKLLPADKHKFCYFYVP